MTLLLLSALAVAGKLADGWRGRPFGPAETIADPPGASCVANPAAGVRWRCDERVGDAPVRVSYQVDEGTFLSVLITCEGYTACSTVLDTLSAAWGPPHTKHENEVLSLRFWSDGASVGGWQYDQLSKSGVAVAHDTEVTAKVKAAKAARARAAAEEL